MSLLDDIPSCLLTHGPLSHAQKRIYVDELIRFNSNSTNYNMVFTLDIPSQHIDHLKISLNHLINRHSIFRTHLTIDSDVSQHITNFDDHVVDYDVVFINNKDEYNLMYDSLAQTFLDTQKKSHFIRLLTNHNDINILCIVIHHMFFDGVSYTILQDEFEHLFYDPDQPLENIGCQYIDYTIFEYQLLESQESKNNLQWWVNHLIDSCNYETEIVLDRARTNNRSSHGNSFFFVFRDDVSKNINQFITQHKITSNVFLHFVIYVLLSRLTQQNQVVLGSNVANRYLNDIENVIGVFVNTISYNLNVYLDSSISDTVSTIKRYALNAGKKSYIPFNEITKYLNVQVRNGTHPLFQFFFSTHPFQHQNKTPDIVEKSNEIFELNFDIIFKLFNNNFGTELEIQYTRDILDDDTTKNIFHRLINVI